MSKAIKKARDFTKEDVLRIWTMRAGGKMNKEIADEIGCSEPDASDVIFRERGPVVPIPKAIREAALKTRHPRARKNSPKNKKAALEAILDTALPNYIAACVAVERARADVEEAREVCMKTGISEDTLKLLRLAAEEQVRS